MPTGRDAVGFRFGRSDHRDGIIPAGWHHKSAIEIQSGEIENLPLSQTYDIHLCSREVQTMLNRKNYILYDIYYLQYGI
jgi:hypothetical protein